MRIKEISKISTFPMRKYRKQRPLQIINVSTSNTARIKERVGTKLSAKNLHIVKYSYFIGTISTRYSKKAVIVIINLDLVAIIHPSPIKFTRKTLSTIKTKSLTKIHRLYLLFVCFSSRKGLK